MATDIMGLFADVNPMANYMKQQQAFQQNLSQAVTPQQFIATVGTNLGGQLGQVAQQAGLFGGNQQSPQEQRAAKRLEALQAAGASGVDQKDGVAFTREVQKQLRARGLNAEAFALESQAQDYADKAQELQQKAALNEARIGAYERQGQTTDGKGTGTERMLDFIADVRKRLYQGQSVDRAEYEKAADYIQQLSKPKSYVDDQGRIVQTAQATVTPLPPFPGTSTTTGETTSGGARITQTPASQEAAQKQETRQKLQSFQVGENLNTIKEASNLVSGWTTGVGSYLKALPTTDAKTLSSKIQTIKANLGFDRLQQMRDASPTGGALGQVAIQELDALQSSVASLDQELSPAELRVNLGKVQKHYQNWLDIMRGGTPLKEPTEPQPQMKPTMVFNKKTGKLEKL